MIIVINHFLTYGLFFHVYYAITVSGGEENGRNGESESDISMSACLHTYCLVCHVFANLNI